MFESHHILRRLKLNLGAYSFGYLINILNQLALLPVYLHYWPKTLYGEWLVLSALPVYVDAADFGLGLITSNRMCLASAKGDDESAVRVLHTTWTFQVGFLGILFMILTAAIAWGNPSEWLSIHNLESHELKMALFLLMIRSLLLCQIRILSAVYASQLQAARAIFLQNVARLADLILCVIMVMAGAGVVGVSASMLGVYMAALAWMHVDMHRTCPRYKLGWSRFSMSELKGCLRDGLSFQLLPSSGLFLMQGMTLVVNFVMGPSAVVVYNTTRAVCRVSLLGVQMSSWAARPELALLFGRSDFSKVRRIFQTMVKLSFWISVAACLGILALGHWGISLLTQGKVAASGWFLLFFALGMITSGFWNGASILLTGVNRHRNFAAATFVLSFLILPLSVLLMKGMGLPGAPLAVLVIDLVICAYVWYECRKVLEEVSPLSLSETLSFPGRSLFLAIFSSAPPKQPNPIRDLDKEKKRVQKSL